jgi:Helix-turn-helix domain
VHHFFMPKNDLKQPLKPVHQLFIDSLVDEVAERVRQRLAGEITQPRLLDVRQAAVYLGRTDKAVRHMQANGSLRPVKLDDRVQFDRKDLDVFIENSKV